MSSFTSFFISSKKTDQGWDLEFNDARIQLHEDMSLAWAECKDQEKLLDSFNNFLVLCDNIENNDAKLDAAVESFVNHNGELSMALGIDIAQEDANQAGTEVTEKKQGIFRRAWEAIKAFFRKICNFIIKGFLYLRKHVFGAKAEKRAKELSENAPKVAESVNQAVASEQKVDSDIGLIPTPAMYENYMQHVDDSIEDCKHMIESMLNSMNSISAASWPAFIKSQSDDCVQACDMLKQMFNEKIIQIIPRSILDNMRGSSSEGQEFALPVLKFRIETSPNISQLKAAGWTEPNIIAQTINRYNLTKNAQEKIQKNVEILRQYSEEFSRRDFSDDSFMRKGQAGSILFQANLNFIAVSFNMAIKLSKFGDTVNSVIANATNVPTETK